MSGSPRRHVERFVRLAVVGVLVIAFGASTAAAATSTPVGARVAGARAAAAAGTRATVGQHRAPGADGECARGLQSVAPAVTA